jgi:hypothetical protein
MTLATLIVFANTLLATPEPPKTPDTSTLSAVDANARSVIVIDPKTRSADYVQAFEFLRKDKPSQKIIIETTAGTLSNISDVSSGGTLLIVKYMSNQGVKAQVIPVEQIKEISYSP